MDETVSTQAAKILGNVRAEIESFSYQRLLQFVIHRLNIHHHVNLDRLSKHSGIPFYRLDEARRIREDRKQLELTHTEHIALVCTCFHLGAPDLGLALMEYGMEDWVRCSKRSESSDEKEARRLEALQFLRAAIADVEKL
jgi:hypothetical protein